MVKNREVKEGELVCASALDGWSSMAAIQEWIASSNSSFHGVESQRATIGFGGSTN